MKTVYHLFLLFALTANLRVTATDFFVQVDKGKFVRAGKPYYFMGTNFWYGPILGSEGEGGGRERLIKELDFLAMAGINNLRILVGAEGSGDNTFRVKPVLQPEPGLYNKELLNGLDFLLYEMSKRNMVAVLYLNNSWDWSGGYGQYLEWNGYGEAPVIVGPDFNWDAYQAFNGNFNRCEPCIKQFHNHIAYIIGRTNSYTGKPYTEDPVIMAWEVANEPRPFGAKNIEGFKQMISSTVSLINSLDPNHLVTTGTEGEMGCQNSIALFEEIHTDPNIDYLTFHVWPKNWNYIDVADITGSVDEAIQRTNEYIQMHVEVARKLQKPLVAEEFGFPRDMHGYLPEEPVTARDKYVENIFKIVIEHAQLNDVLCGANFWSYGGFGRPSQLWFKEGDDFLGDPPCEEQGLNSVYNIDSTISIIKQYVDLINK